MSWFSIYCYVSRSEFSLVLHVGIRLLLYSQPGFPKLLSLLLLVFAASFHQGNHPRMFFVGLCLSLFLQNERERETNSILCLLLIQFYQTFGRRVSIERRTETLIKSRGNYREDLVAFVTRREHQDEERERLSSIRWSKVSVESRISRSSMLFEVDSTPIDRRYSRSSLSLIMRLEYGHRCLSVSSGGFVDFDIFCSMNICVFLTSTSRNINRSNECL
jgi:hypothetical protein